MKLEKKRYMSRKDAGLLLMRLGKMMIDGEPIQMGSTRVEIPDTMNVELEYKEKPMEQGVRNKLEVELVWRNPAPSLTPLAHFGSAVRELIGQLRGNLGFSPVKTAPLSIDIKPESIPLKQSITMDKPQKTK